MVTVSPEWLRIVTMVVFKSGNQSGIAECEKLSNLFSVVYVECVEGIPLRKQPYATADKCVVFLATIPTMSD